MILQVEDDGRLPLSAYRRAVVTIAFLICDSGLKYLSTDLFSDAR